MENTISYERAIQIIQKLLNWIDDSTCDTSETRDTLINHCYIGREEIKELGYGYLIDTENEDEEKNNEY